MSRFSVSSGAAFNITILPDWPINIESADLSGNVGVSLPSEDPNAFNRPVNVHVIYFPGTVPAGATAASVLATPGIAQASVPTPAPAPTGQSLNFTVTVPLPLPNGNVTVLAIGEYTV